MYSTTTTTMSVGIVLLLASGCVLAQTLPPPPPRLDVIHVPLSFGNNQQYTAKVNMSIGNTQRFNFVLSTSTGNTLVANTSCTTCAGAGVPTYNATQSTTAQQINNSTTQQAVSIASGIVNLGSGVVSRENCSLAQANGSVWNYRDQPIVQVSSSSVFTNGTSGLIGLAASDFNNTPFNGWFQRNPLQHNFTFGLALAPPPSSQATLPDDTSASAGMMHMMQPDPAAYSGGISWYDVPVVNATSDGSSGAGDGDGTAWVLGIDGWNMKSGGAQSSNVDGGAATIEPFFASIFMPRAQATQLYATIPSSTPLPVALSSDIGQTFSIPCDSSFSFGIVVNGSTYPIPQDSLVLHGSDGTCVGAIEGWADSARGDYLLGSRFISAYYVVFQVGRPGGPAAGQKIGLAPRADATSGAAVAKKSHTGAIVGGVVGGVAFILILFGLLFWYIRHRTRRVALPVEKDTYPSEKHTGVATSPQNSLFHTHSTLAYATTEPYYPPPSAHTGSPQSAHDPSFPPPLQSPPHTATSETGLLQQQQQHQRDGSSPRVNQWVEGYKPPNNYDVPPARFDYGN